MEKLNEKRNGFTLIEILAVIIILGIILLIVVPSVTDYIQKSKREEFVETLFNALESTKASTNSELAANWLKNSGKIIKSFSDLDPEIKKSAGHTASEFFKLAGKNIYNEYKLF